ncbi:hypothetical protein [Pararhodobacter aggregans]|uniref:helix-turn-helix domain-containing protein n=1 Tax=Pararhodobacter aggregans TaxID=404875 RepID=UPI003A8D09F6
MTRFHFGLADLRGFQKDLEPVVKVAEILDAAGLEPRITLSEAETLVRVPSILPLSDGDADAGDDPLILIEDCADEPDSSAAADAGLQERLAEIETQFCVQRAQLAFCQAQIEDVTAELTAATVQRMEILETAVAELTRQTAAPAEPLRTGPFDPAEKARALQLHAAGRSNAEIAAALGRSVGGINMVLRRWLQADQKQASGGGSIGLDAPVPPSGEEAAAGLVAADLEPAVPARLDRARSAEAAPGGVEHQTSGAGDAPQSAPGAAGTRKHPPASGDPSSRAGGVAAPAAAQVPPPGPSQEVAAKPAKGPAPPADFTVLDRALWRHVVTLPPGAFGPGDDLDLVEGLARGRKLAEIALDLDIDAAACLSRFKALSATLRNDLNAITHEGQPRLLKVLRARVAQISGEPSA